MQVDGVGELARWTLRLFSDVCGLALHRPTCSLGIVERAPRRKLLLPHCSSKTLFYPTRNPGEGPALGPLTDSQWRSAASKALGMFRNASGSAVPPSRKASLAIVNGVNRQTRPLPCRCLVPSGSVCKKGSSPASDGLVLTWFGYSCGCVKQASDQRGAVHINLAKNSRPILPWRGSVRQARDRAVTAACVEPHPMIVPSSRCIYTMQNQCIDCVALP